jgi:hypothetical protein
MKRTALVFVSYAILAGITLALWARAARTEFVDKGPDGEPQYSCSNLCKLIDATAANPFVGRRLLPDSAALLARAIPEAVWDSLKDYLERDSYPARNLRRALDWLGWQPELYPVVFSGYFLIGLSILGFMYASRQLARFFYDMPDRLADVLGGLFGLGLLGGTDRAGDWAACPYDFPNAFVFVLCVYAIVARRWWLLPVFILACYSKETALLLIIGYAVVHRASYRQLSYWLVLLAMSGLYLGIRAWISTHYDTPPDEDYWFPRRNSVFMIRELIHNGWWLFIAAIACVQIFQIRRQLPRDLLSLSVAMGVVILGAAFFKGRIEERRQYLEVYPLVGLMVLQWASLALGIGHLFRPKNPPEMPAVEEVTG